MADESYYPRLRDKFDDKRDLCLGRSPGSGVRYLQFGLGVLSVGANTGSNINDAITFNEMLMEKAGVGMTPGSAFADSDTWDAHVRICIAREDSILEGAMEKLRKVLD